MKLTDAGFVEITIVDGNSLVGLYAADGSMNVYDASLDSSPLGLYHESGAMRIFKVDGTAITGLYAANGARNWINLTASNVGGKPQHPCGALQGDTNIP